MAGIYVHIPFCKQKCTYCDFHFSTTYESYKKRMVLALLSELKQRKDYLKDEIVETIYFGGGTPSLLTTFELDKILDTIRSYYQLSTNPEVTLETNPDDINTEVLIAWKNIGVNRLSIGIQSYRQKDLDWMNRAHNVAEAQNCVRLAKNAGFSNITVDLIYGLPDYSILEWQDAIRATIDMDVPHISAYCLTVEQRTVLNKMVQKGEITPADEDQQSDHFLILVNELEKANFSQYEISNFAIDGFESKHNSNYWKGKPYLGIGPSAHSFIGNSRRWNIANNYKYMDGIETNSIYWEEELLSSKDQFNETLLTGLRTSSGVELKKLFTYGESNQDFNNKINEFVRLGWLIANNNQIVLTKEGRLKADFIASELFRD